MALKEGLGLCWASQGGKSSDPAKYIENTGCLQAKTCKISICRGGVLWNRTNGVGCDDRETLSVHLPCTLRGGREGESDLGDRCGVNNVGLLWLGAEHGRRTAEFSRIFLDQGEESRNLDHFRMFPGVDFNLPLAFRF